MGGGPSWGRGHREEHQKVFADRAAWRRDKEKLRGERESVDGQGDFAALTG